MDRVDDSIYPGEPCYNPVIQVRLLCVDVNGIESATTNQSADFIEELYLLTERDVEYLETSRPKAASIRPLGRTGGQDCMGLGNVEPQWRSDSQHDLRTGWA